MLSLADMPWSTSIAIATAGLLISVSCLMSRLGGRLGLPVSLIFLVIGVFAGSEMLGGINFENYALAYICGTLALVVILFDGGLNTRMSAVRRMAAPSLTLATLGVAGVAAITAVAARLLGLAWPEAMLFGAIVSSTDAAAVFAALRGVRLREKLRETLELESGMNDPMAVILATAMTAHMIMDQPLGWWLVGALVWQLLAGAGCGLAIGYLSRWALRAIPLSTPGLYPVLTLGVALLAYGVPGLVDGSGFLSVYVAGLILGNGHMPYKSNLARVHDAMAWLAQVLMFLLLGLLIFPSQLIEVWWIGLILALVVAFIARPIAVTLCLLPFRFNWEEVLCLSWLGLRGAVPIIIATVPVLAASQADVPQGQAIQLFNIVFFVVVVGSFIPGSTIRWVIRWLRLARESEPVPQVELDLISHGPLNAVQRSYFIRENSQAQGKTLGELADQMPADATVLMVVRGKQLVPPRGTTRFENGDHVHVLSDPASKYEVDRIFGE